MIYLCVELFEDLVRDYVNDEDDNMHIDKIKKKLPCLEKAELRTDWLSTVLTFKRQDIKCNLKFPPAICTLKRMNILYMIKVNLRLDSYPISPVIIKVLVAQHDIQTNRGKTKGFLKMG